MEYLIGLLKKAEPDWEELFKRLERFYLEWCDGRFIDATAETLPQRKARQLQQNQVDSKQRQVDIFAGLNVLILLLEIHRHAQTVDALKTAIYFYPCGQFGAVDSDGTRLLRMIRYSDSLQLGTFGQIVGHFLSSAYLSGADLRRADLLSANLVNATLVNAYLDNAYLSCANLSSANFCGAYLRGADLDEANFSSADLSDAKLSSANLKGAYLIGADLSSADLNEANFSSAILKGAYLIDANLISANLRSANRSDADLSGANLNSADLSRAKFTGANLRWADLSGATLRGANLSSANVHEIRWDGATHWAGAQGLHAALNVPETLAQTPRFKAALVLSQGIDECKQGNVLAAIQAYQNAQLIDTGLEIDANTWDLLCWVGALYNQAPDILYASEKAIYAKPDSPIYRITRGLVRALTVDLQGAIEDFQSVLEKVDGFHAFDNTYRSVNFGDAVQIREWLKAIQLGENPFTPEALEALRRQAGIGYDGEAAQAKDENG